MKISLPLTIFLCAVLSSGDPFTETVCTITASHQARIGVSVIGIEDDTALEINTGKYPMESVFKFHIALAVLHEVDRGSLLMDQTIVITKDDLAEKTWSPIKDRYPDGAKLPLSEVLKLTVEQSDNIGCDILLRLIGGPGKVNDYIRSLGIRDAEIAVTEKQMHEKRDDQYRNWTTPQAASQLLKKFCTGKILSEKSTSLLLSLLSGATTGTKRLSAGLPPKTPLAHKTGTSGTSGGITAGVNDIGIVTMPDGRRYAISVFVADSRESMETNEKIIAAISKAAWTFFAAGK